MLLSARHNNNFKNTFFRKSKKKNKKKIRRADIAGIFNIYTVLLYLSFQDKKKRRQNRKHSAAQKPSTGELWSLQHILKHKYKGPTNWYLLSTGLSDLLTWLAI